MVNIGQWCVLVNRTCTEAAGCNNCAANPLGPAFEEHEVSVDDLRLVVLRRN